MRLQYCRGRVGRNNLDILTDGQLPVQDGQVGQDGPLTGRQLPVQDGQVGHVLLLLELGRVAFKNLGFGQLGGL